MITVAIDETVTVTVTVAAMGHLDEYGGGGGGGGPYWARPDERSKAKVAKIEKRDMMLDSFLTRAVYSRVVSRKELKVLKTKIDAAQCPPWTYRESRKANEQRMRRERKQHREKS